MIEGLLSEAKKKKTKAILHTRSVVTVPEMCFRLEVSTVLDSFSNLFLCHPVEVPNKVA